MKKRVFVLRLVADSVRLVVELNDLATPDEIAAILISRLEPIDVDIEEGELDEDDE